MSKLKRHIAIALTILMISPSIISVFSFSYIQWIKHEMKEKLESSNLQAITLNNKDIIWYEQEKEIIINGSLFDIKSYTINNDKTTFIGIFDKEESKMSVFAEKFVSKTPAHKHLADIGSFFQLIQFFNPSMFTFQPLIPIESVQYSADKTFITTHFNIVPTPPPNICLS